MFGREEFGVLAEALRGLQGRFILSLNDRPEVRETFAGFAIEEVETTYTIAAGSAQSGRKELIISGPLVGRNRTARAARLRAHYQGPFRTQPSYAPS